MQEDIESFEFKDLIPSFLPTTKSLFQHHLRSFNFLLQKKFPQIIHAKVNNIVQSEENPKFFIKYKDIRVQKPIIFQNFSQRKLFPQECRLRDLTYSGNIEVDLEIRYDDETEGFYRSLNNIRIGKVPIMIGSDYCLLSQMSNEQKQQVQECENGPSGYFIIKGLEKVILMQEQLCRNKILVDEDSKTNILQVSCASATLETKSKIWIIIKHHRLFLKSSSFEEPIPLFIIFKAIGVENDKEIVEIINPFLNDKEYKKYQNEFENIIYLSFESLIKHRILTEQDALDHLTSKIRYLYFNQSQRNREQKLLEVQKILQKIILPHIHASEKDFLHKINYFGLMTRRLLREFLKINKLQEGQTDIRNDRDYLGNKRIECAGDLLSLLFEDLFKRFNSELKTQIDKKIKSRKKPKMHELIDDIQFMCQSETITHGLQQAISSGKWQIKRFRVDRQGVTQLMNRINYLGAIGMLTRLESHIEKSQKVSGPRSLQCSHWGFICPVDTPDGENCGLVKNLALLAKITTESEDYSILNLLDQLGLIELGIFQLKQMRQNPNLWAIVMNGRIVGGVDDCQNFVTEFKKLRKRGVINKYVSIFEDKEDRVVDIWSDAGRMVRPLLNYKELQQNWSRFLSVLKTHKFPTKNIQDCNQLVKILLNEGFVDYLDVNELNNCNISFSVLELNHNTTHIEFSYDIILGVLAGIIPYPQHNQSPRNTYQCAMAKQSLGMLGYNQLQRIDTVMYQMIYPQKPLISTNTLKLIKFDELPAGINACIAIMSFSGYDIEDAVVLNRGSIERGFARSVISKKYVVEFERGQFNFGDTLVKTYSDQDGIVKINQRVKFNQILVNKYSQNGEDQFEAHPKKYKEKVQGRVDKVYLTSSGSNYLLAKMLIRQVRIPEVGDKFSSRHGQKGVIGIKVDQVDLPFTENGWSPDLIMNPHGFPSRMTVGKLLELISSKASALKAKFFLGSAFEDKEICKKCKKKCECKSVAKNFGKMLIEYGYNYQGTEVMISGSSGEYLKGYIFAGPVYYQRLKHMVKDKIHSLSKGKKTFLTRQPLEGRAKEGGFRLGEMERDCLLAYGASEILLERFLLASDEYQCPVCSNCGEITCNGSCISPKAQIKHVRMPYPTKLLFQELISMNIIPKIKLKSKINQL